MKDLHEKFAIKTLSFMNYFLRFETYRNQSGLYLTQTKYTLDILEKAKMARVNPNSTPFFSWG